GRPVLSSADTSLPESSARNPESTSWNPWVKSRVHTPYVVPRGTPVATSRYRRDADAGASGCDTSTSWRPTPGVARSGSSTTAAWAPTVAAVASTSVTASPRRETAAVTGSG